MTTNVPAASYPVPAVKPAWAYKILRPFPRVLSVSIYHCHVAGSRHGSDFHRFKDYFIQALQEGAAFDPPPASAFSEDVGVHRSQQSRGAVLVGQRERGVLRCRSDLGCATVDSRILCWFVLGLYLGAFSPPLRRGKGDDQIHGCRLLESDILRCTCGQ